MISKHGIKNNYIPWLPTGLVHVACGNTITGWGAATNGLETGAGANKAGLPLNIGANELEPNTASAVVFEPNVVCAVELAPNSGSSEVEVLLNAVWELAAFAPNVGCDADIENRLSLIGEEWKLPLTLAASWSEGRVGDVNVDAEYLAAGSLALLDAADEFDTICFILCCCKNAHQTAQF